MATDGDDPSALNLSTRERRAALSEVDPQLALIAEALVDVAHHEHLAGKSKTKTCLYLYLVLCFVLFLITVL